MNWIFQAVGQLHPSLANLRGGPLWVFLLVVGLTLIFLLAYVIKGTQVGWQLKSAIRGVLALRKLSQAPTPQDLAAVFQREPLQRLWDEYADTLHAFRQASPHDTSRTEIRATVPAETVFTRDALVDSRLFDEFTRHIPGVLTGLGIIGTFAGLLGGLSAFDPSSPQTAVSGLKPLMSGVEHAFVASGVAIACAMFVVFFSKLTLAYFYLLVDRLNQAIDSLYATGSGEDYLSRLVKAAESNEVRTAQFKDTLMEDISRMMTTLVERQIAAHDQTTRHLGDRIGQSIANSLSEPMRRMGDVMEQTHKGQGEQVSHVLETLLTGFMTKLEDTFGGQMRGINEQMQKSMDAMTSVQASMQTLLGDLKTTNEQATRQMSGQLEEAMKQSTESQLLLTAEMREFVLAFRKQVTEEQSKSSRAMDDSVMKVIHEVARATEKLEDTRQVSAQEEKGRNDQLNQKTTELVDSLSGQVTSLLAAVADQVTKTQNNISAIEQVSIHAIDGMNRGALNMGTAATRFELAGNSVSTVFDHSATLSHQLVSAASTLQEASQAVQKGLAQYESTRQVVDAQLSALMGLIDSAKREAGVSVDLIASLQTSARAMQAAETASREHLNQVNAALVQAFNDFGRQMVSQVKDTIALTDTHLKQGTGHLNGVVQELAHAVHQMRRN